MRQSYSSELRAPNSERRFRHSALGVRRSGMLLLELLISLAISVTLLVAIAAAFSATSAAIETNAHFFTAPQAARVSMNQLLSITRRSDACQPGNYDNVSTAWTSSSLGVIYHDPDTTSQHPCPYQYSSTASELQLVQNSH